MARTFNIVSYSNVRKSIIRGKIIPGATSFTFYINIGKKYQISSLLNHTHDGIPITVPVDSEGNWAWLNSTNFKITSLHGAFFNCKELIDITFDKNMDTKDVLYISDMFNCCVNLKSVNGIKSLNLTSVINSEFMFHKCESLSMLDLSNMNMPNNTEFEAMFARCSNITSIDITGWNTSKAKNIGGVFLGCKNLIEIKGIGDIDTGSVVFADNIFNGCESLTEDAIEGISGWNTGGFKYIQNMFTDCFNIVKLDLSKWNTSNCIDVRELFLGCKSIKYINLSGFNVMNAEKYDNMFDNNEDLIVLYNKSLWPFKIYSIFCVKWIDIQ